MAISILSPKANHAAAWLLALLAWPAAAQIQVAIPDGGGDVFIEQPAGEPGLICTPAGGPDCQTVASSTGQPGDVFVFSAAPLPGWDLVDWRLNGASIGSGFSVQLGPYTAVPNDLLEAVYEPLLSVMVNGTGGGTVTSNDGSIVCGVGQVCERTYSRSHSAPIILTATPQSGSVFAGWNQPGGGNACTDPLASTCELSAQGFGFGALPNGVTATFELEQSILDGDGDGVEDGADLCPGTPAGEPVDVNGCSVGQQDADGDGVADELDLCPATPPGELPDVDGCADSQVFQLSVEFQGTGSGRIQDPNEPAKFCDASCQIRAQPTTSVEVSAVPDAGSAFFGWDGLCAGTPVDANCQLELTAGGSGTLIVVFNATTDIDNDGDGIVDAEDQCPDTVAGAVVDATGCALDVPVTEPDADGDGVPDTGDQCPDTPAGTTVDAVGCDSGGSTLDPGSDGDGDGVPDALDSCPDTAVDVAVDPAGCSEGQRDIQSFGDELGDLSGLTGAQAESARVIDDVCPVLLNTAEDSLSAVQQDLRRACSALKSSASTAEQQLAALAAITPEQISNRADSALDTGNTQMRHMVQRLMRIRRGDSRGLSLSGLNVSIANQFMPGAVLEQAVDTALGGAEDFSDFGRWGVFLQGDIDMADRRDSNPGAAYNSDSWLVTAGADYRFRPDLYAGVAFNYGRSDTDYAQAKTDIDTLGATFYGGWQFSEQGYLDLVVGYLNDDYRMVRDVSYSDSGGDFSARYLADTSGHQFTAGLNTGWMFNRGGWRFGPTASIALMDGQVDGYTERAAAGDSAAWSLRVDDVDYSQVVTRLGVQLDYAWLTDFGVLIPGVVANWVSETQRRSGVAQSRLASGLTGYGDSLEVERRYRDGRYYDVALNLSAQLSYGVSAWGSYRFTGARDRFSHRGYTLGVRWDQAF